MSRSLFVIGNDSKRYGTMTMLPLLHLPHLTWYELHRGCFINVFSITMNEKQRTVLSLAFRLP